MRHTRFILCNCKDLDINHNHSLYFSTASKQIEYFMSKKIFLIEDCYYHRKHRSIKVEKSFDNLQFVNYVVSQNDETGKYYFYFVYDREYTNDNITTLYLKLDVIQTYLFDMDLNSNLSLVDRIHYDRYDSITGLPSFINLNNDENLEVGEYIEKSRKTIFDYSSMGGYIVTSSDKLSAKNGGSTGSNTGGNSYINGYCSENGFVLIKSMEAFASKPYDIGDGTRTTGYGVTEKYEPDYFNQLLPSCNEQKASEVFGKLLYKKYSQYVYNLLKEYGKDMSTVKQCEFDAFVSFYYNHGNLTKKQIFIDYINGVDKNKIYETWLTTIIMSGSQFEQGLRDRRKREATAFRDGIYNCKSIVNLTTGELIKDNNGKGFIPEEYKSKSVDNSLGNKIIESARSLIDKPYIFGGNYPPLGKDKGTDCSGLCQWAYNQNGKKITRTTYTQIKEGIEVSKENLKIGDLIFSNFSSPNVPEHVYLFSGVVDGNYMCVEAPRTGLNIRERSFEWTNGMRARRLL